jgi:hypothetical protein
MSKITSLDLRAVVQHQIFKRERTAAKFIIPDCPVRNDNRSPRETSYRDAKGFAAHCRDWFLMRHNL